MLINGRHNFAQVLGMWQAQQPEQTMVIQRARSDAQQQQQQATAAAGAASAAPPAVSTGIAAGYSAFSQQRDTASPSPQVRFRT